ncbi:MAG: hypothetical protein ABSG68_16540 [Thermoguttaceae bacterium]|jgi:hypothetical protein
MPQQPDAAFAHPDCYARELGGCSRQISKEHYVSDAILRQVSLGEPSVLVRNLHFQEPSTQERKGISSLVAKVLCSKHNSHLSPFDVAGFSLVSGMDEINRTVGQVEDEETFVVNGDDLERWMLKTLCGGLFSGNIPLPDGTLKGICPPKHWLDILFCNGRFPAEQGLYVRAGTPGVVFATDPSILKMEVLHEQNFVVGFRVLVFNFQFILVLASLPPQPPAMLEHAQYRPQGIVVQGSNTRIQIAWQDGTAGDELVVKWVGRE